MTPVLREPDFWVLPVHGVDICFHAADRKGAPGAAGSVWRVDDLDTALRRATERGGSLHRGPLAVDHGDAVCQILDPFGNLFGLVGPRLSGRPSPGEGLGLEAIDRSTERLPD